MYLRQCVTLVLVKNPDHLCLTCFLVGSASWTLSRPSWMRLELLLASSVLELKKLLPLDFVLCTRNRAYINQIFCNFNYLTLVEGFLECLPWNDPEWLLLAEISLAETGTNRVNGSSCVIKVFCLIELPYRL